MATILVVGDKSNRFTTLSRALARQIEDCSFHFVPPGSEGLDRARNDPPDVILIDGSRVDGEICQRLKNSKETSEIPVLAILNGKTASKRRQEFLAKGADIALAATLSDSEIAAQVSAVLQMKKRCDCLCNEKDLLEAKLRELTEALRERTYDLDRRVKELNCLYGISDLREKPDISLEELLQGVVDLIPSSLQHSEITGARIFLGYQEFKTKNFNETPWSQRCDIMVHGEWAGTLEVYHSAKPEAEGGVLLKEERSLLNAISERLGRIAERVQAEESLRLESGNITSILKSMEDLVYKVNEQFDMEYINPALEQEFGPVEGKKCYEYFRALKEPCAKCKIEEVLLGSTVRRERYFSNSQKTYDVIETPLRNPDGTVSKLSLSRDLTPIKQAQKALEEREMLYRSITESAADGAVMVQDGKILFVNHAFVNMFGYDDPSELTGFEIVRLFDSEFRGLFRKVFDPAEQDGNFMNLLRGVCVSKDGRKFWVSTNRSVISLKSKPAILAILRDITEDMLQERSIQEVTERLRRENIKLRSCIKERYRFGNIIGKSLPMQNVYELILKAAASKANVIILGESGTGKELVARAIHEMSARADKAFVPVNCGAIPENLVESEFFGHRKGAFTGAHIDKTGYLHTADGGTLFLDEVGELGLNMQVKLLRALETGEYTPIGDTRFRRSDARIISATNRDFNAMVNKGMVREDFYYRISVIPIVLPTLREKKEDIPLLIEHFLKLYSKQGKIPTIPGKIVEVLYNYDWPGNVRELQSVIQRYLAVGNFDFLSLGGKTHALESAESEGPMEVTKLRAATADFEKRYILTALKQNRWHRTKVAAALGIDPKTLYTKMKKIGLS
jgi:PAS domain S-box-containing protein